MSDRSLHRAAVIARFSNSGSAAKWKDVYDFESKRLDHMSFRRRRDLAVERVLEVLPPDGRVLDVGCGSAPVLAELRRRGVDCIGVECAPDMLEHARGRLLSLRLDANGLCRADCMQLPFSDGTFDLVVCLGVISYVEDVAAALREIQRVLKPGGRALIGFRNRFNRILWDPVRLAQLAVGRLPPEPKVIGRFMDHREVDAEMQAAGFVHESHYGIGFGPLRFNGRPMLPEAASIRLSEMLSRLMAGGRAATPGLWLADVSVSMYRRSP